METKKDTATSAEFAVIQTGGKQYKVKVGDTITIEKLFPPTRDAEFKKGDEIVFNKVLLSDNGTKTICGAPFITNLSVKGEFVSAGRAPKINVIKYLQKSRYFKKNGHRQPFIKVKILSLV